MKLSTVVMLLLLKGILAAQAPSFGWSKQAGGLGDEQYSFLATDLQGNVYATGSFNSASVVISNSVITNSGTTTRDFFIAKYSKSGNLIWVYKAGALGDDEVKGICTDASGNVIITGNFDSPSLSIGTNVLTNASGSTDIFLIKLNSAGTPLWSFAFGGSLLEDAAGLCSDNSGNIILSGSFRSLSVNFGGVGVINNGGSDGFVTKFSTAGVAQWTRQIGGSGDELVRAVSTDSNANVYVGGDFNSAVLATYGFTCQGQFDIFLGRYDLTTGNFIAARQIGGSQSENLQALAATSSAEVYVAASFASPSLNLGSISVNLGSSRDMLLMKLTTSMQTTWANRYNGNSASNFSALCRVGSGLVVSGYFNTSTLAIGTLAFSNVNNLSEGFVAQFTGAGVPNWGVQTGGAGDERILAVQADNTGSYFLSGSFSASLSIGGVTLNSGGLQDALLSKLCNLPALPVVTGPSFICRGTVATLTAQAMSGIEYSWYNSATASQPVLSASNLFTTSTAGTYYALAQTTVNGCFSAGRTAFSFSQPAAPVVSISGKTLTSSPAATYQWLRCDRDSVLTGVTAASYALSFSGYFSVATVLNGCKDTSACVFYSVNAVTGTVTVPGDTIKVVTQVAVHSRAAFLRFSPNPSSGHLRIQVPEACDLEVFSVNGMLVRRIRLSAGVHDEDWSDLSAGCYLIRQQQTQQHIYFIRLP